MTPGYSRPETVKNTRAKTAHSVIALQPSKQILSTGIKKFNTSYAKYQV
jgi:hypothetical protein